MYTNKADKLNTVVRFEIDVPALLQKVGFGRGFQNQSVVNSQPWLTT